MLVPYSYGGWKPTRYQPKLFMQPNQASITRTHHTQTHLWNLGHKVLYTKLEGAMPKWKGMILLGQICTDAFFGGFPSGRERKHLHRLLFGLALYGPFSSNHAANEQANGQQRTLVHCCEFIWAYQILQPKWQRAYKKLMMCCSNQWTTPPPQIDVRRILHRIMYA